MPTITCPACGSEDLDRDPTSSASDGSIAIVCLGCGYRFVREPRMSCPRCTSDDIEQGTYQGWAFNDAEQARDDPMAPYLDLERETFRCRQCNHRWRRSWPMDAPRTVTRGIGTGPVEAAALIASLAPGAAPLTIREPLADDESKWFLRAIEEELISFRTCPEDCFRFRKWGLAGPDHFETPAGKPRHLFSTPSSEQAWLNREYVPHIAAYARAVNDFGYPAERASFSRYRTYQRDLITKRAGASYETDLEFADTAGELTLQVEAKRQPREIQRMADALDHAGELERLPIEIVKEIEYVLDLRPRLLWLVGPGTIDPTAHVYEVRVDDLHATFNRIPELPRPR